MAVGAYRLLQDDVQEAVKGCEVERANTSLGRLSPKEEAEADIAGQSPAHTLCCPYHGLCHDRQQQKQQGIRPSNEHSKDDSQMTLRWKQS